LYWTDERTRDLTELWGRGLSGGEIAERLGGVSRNAVIGKANRLGLASRLQTEVQLEQAPVSKTAPEPHFAPIKIANMGLGDSSITLVDSQQNEFDIDNETLELGNSERRLSTSSLDLSVDMLVARVDRGGLVLQPEFQREYVWTSSKASLLIESILMRIPLPVVYFSEAPDGGWEVVDGQQRLTSIYCFVRGHFPDGGSFRLSKLNVRSELKGLSFKDLPKADQNAILNYTLRAIVLLNDCHPDLKFEVFERLNCGSVQLKDAELRNCMYRGPYNDMLAELSQNPSLLRIRRSTTPHRRMDDRQLILRFLAMKRNTHLNYRGSMKQFMNHEMVDNRFASPSDIANMKKTFEDAIECAWIVFDSNAFRRWTPAQPAQSSSSWDSKLNIALWDTVLYSFALFEKRQIITAADAVREEFFEMMANDADFVDCIGRSTDNHQRLRYRAETWLARLRATLTVPANERRSFSIQLKAALHLENPACAICDQRIPSIDDAEVDHIKHYWRGGATIPENSRLTHRFCNRSRGGRED
jgi:hypothetical protein